MNMIDTSYFKEKFDQLQAAHPDSVMSAIRQEGFENFNKVGLPTLKHEEWKYTGISSLFNKEYSLSSEEELSITDIDAIRLPGHEQANELVFINGRFDPSLSIIRSNASQLVILPLEDAANGIYANVVKEHLGQSNRYLKDGIHALNTSFIQGGVFIQINKKQELEHPLYLYYLSDTRQNHTLAQPRSLVYVDESAQLQVVETYQTLGALDSFTNQVTEMVVNSNAYVEYYKIQNDADNASQVSTTHIRQIGKSYVHALTITLSGNMIRNNVNLVMEAAGNEAHLYGLYLLNGSTHVDNHTMVDNREPNCFSNEFYKGILDDQSTGVFSGKIFVEPQAQKTNAYQSNKNILLSDHASINTKPQLEIFADDVKCSHGCTVGQLDPEALFYLNTRGISKERAQSMLLQAFAADIVAQVKPKYLLKHIKQLINNRLADKQA